MGVTGGGLHKYPGSLCASTASYPSWVTQKWEGRWVRTLLLQVPLLSVIFFGVEAVRLRWFLGALIPVAVVGWQMGGADQHSEPLRGASSLVAGRRAPVGYVGVERTRPPLGEPRAG